MEGRSLSLIVLFMNKIIMFFVLKNDGYGVMLKDFMGIEYERMVWVLEKS